ncbi:MAG: 4-(cytidine 5'-diphospho)-2-C-methyl-D-erythritol kinase [Nitrospina sp.]|jgi:4-diphosphocytidyl-2-C-methyl-D-erythritol kinase|nr:4-(cytidine 5'-diphospho)-2-C-methyl-D-erythritol kinase [Nitrospina sp.]MBT4556285.1 4-(cytidine 5'-diphospho)-2-C-methyl-D-erythritol kinase [Nitrospina sp.]MBT5632131.1 4-(cytidine 5'-diphospho)-2-C-methyl-D-erythritol kinase [Nitrospina sp.]
MTTLVFKTPAKVNLGLYILGKREDGFHELETLFQMVNWCDEIKIECLAQGLEMTCNQPDIPTDDGNLVIKAAQLLQARFPDRCKGARINLTKNIPHGAGLGGGSGNAAGVLLGLNFLWELNLKRKDLISLASELGSDVPFFLFSPCAIGRSRGEILEPVQSSIKFYVLMVYPGFPLSTAWVYGNLKLKLTKQQNNISILKNFLLQSEYAQLGASWSNDLEAIVFQEYPEIFGIKKEMLALGAKGALLSGSGSTVFGIFDNPETAKNAYARLEGGKFRLFLAESIISLSELYPDEMLATLLP